jgi:hypothetical protein
MRLSNRATYSKSYQVPFASMFDKAMETRVGHMLGFDETDRDRLELRRTGINSTIGQGGWGQIPTL